MSIYQGNKKVLGGVSNIEENKVKEIIDSERPIKTFTNITQLGLSAGCSVEDIFLALPNNSYFECGTASGVDGYSTITNLPTTSTSTLLTIRKYTQARFNIEVKISSGGDVEPNEMYIGQLKGNDGTGLVWNKVCTTKVADVSKIAITWSDITYFKSNAVVSTGNYYQVKNGICYVNIDMFCISPKNGGYTLPITLPRPSLDYVHVNIASLPSGTYEHSSVIMAIFNSGNSVIVYGGKANDRYLGSFSYPVAES